MIFLLISNRIQSQHGIIREYMRSHETTEKNKQPHKQKLIAQNLGILLEQHNLNANQLAQLINIPMMTVRRLLSGETEDPRISTLKLIADYFNISVDLLIEDGPRNILMSSKKIKSYFIPKINWEMLSKVNNIKEFDFNQINVWQLISLKSTDIISKQTFAIESRPSMYPRFPKGTMFIIDPALVPADSDIVLVKFKENNEFTLRELIIDPPEWHLSPLVIDSNSINFNSKNHEIIGVSLLTILYNPKMNG